MADVRADAGPTLPSHHRVVRAVERAIASLDVRWQGQNVVVAVSGGADSTFLLHATCALRRRFGFQIVVAHVNHGWRGEASREDANVVARLGESLGTPVHLLTVADARHAQPRGGIEAAARAVRYAFLAEVARSCDAVAVLVAHTADDQTETIILSLLRGRSVAGLSGMAEASALPVANAPRALLVRPMLAIGAAVVRNTLRASGIAWRTDESNDDRARMRNRVRHEVVPTLEAISPGFRSALARAARDVEAARDMLDDAIQAATRRWQVDKSGWSVARADWLTDALHVRLAALREVLVRVGVSAEVIESGHLRAVDQMVTSNRGGAWRAVGPTTIRLSGGRLTVLAPPEA